MSDYKETEVTGKQWQRCYMVEIYNPSGGIPSIRFNEEKVTIVNEQKITQPCSSISHTFNQEETFQLIDPSTNLPVPERPNMSHEELYSVLYSLYMHLAKKRDLEQI